MSTDPQELLEGYLRSSKLRLELAIENLASKQGYDQQLEKLRIVLEALREQISNENIDSSAR
jgi:hypothetical protein